VFESRALGRILGPKSESRALGRILGPKREDGENCIIRRFIICILHQIMLEYQN
jgi:hypothetical protein